MNGIQKHPGSQGIRLTVWSDTPRRTSEELCAHLRTIGLPPDGLAYVVSAYRNPPARRVGGHRVRNLVFDVPFPQFDVTLQAESASGEYAFLLERSRDASARVILDQPITVFFDITNRAGIRTPVHYTADYLVVYDTKVVVYEVLLRKELDELLATRTVDWRRSEDGLAHYVPAERHFGQLGISHVVYVGDTVSGVHAENLRTLQAVRRQEDSSLLAADRERIIRLLGDGEPLLLSEIVRRLELTSCTPVLQLIDRGRLHADLENCVLADTRSTWVSVDSEVPRQLSRGRARLIDAVGDTRFVEVLNACPPQYEAKFLRRLASCHLVEPDGSPARSRRTTRNYLLTLRRAAGDVRALIPKWHRCGNRLPRKCAKHYEVLSTSIRQARGDPNGSSPAIAFLSYQVALRQALGEGEVPFSRATFYSHYSKLRGAPEDARKKGGRRMGNAESPWLDPMQRTLLPTRPFEVAHIDHWNVDIHVVLPIGPNRKEALKPWLTAMVDSFTGEVLAIWMTFRAPSRNSCAMVLRDCVRRHRRLPEVIVVDGGPEFDSVHFAASLATLGVTRANRSPEDPRFGKEAERLFGAYKERFARGKPGFTDGIKAARKVSGKLSAAKRAEMSLSDLLSSLETYTFASYNSSPAPGELMGRSAIRSESLSSFPFSGLATEWDTRFLILTAVEAPRCSYELAPPRGIRVLGRWYSCPELTAYSGRKGQVHVRIDPFDDSVIYACLKGLWYVCFGSDASRSLHASDLAAFERTSRRHQMRDLMRSVMNAAARDAYELQHSIPPNPPTQVTANTAGYDQHKEEQNAHSRAELGEELSPIALEVETPWV